MNIFHYFHHTNLKAFQDSRPVKSSHSRVATILESNAELPWYEEGNGVVRNSQTKLKHGSPVVTEC